VLDCTIICILLDQTVEMHKNNLDRKVLTPVTIHTVTRCSEYCSLNFYRLESLICSSLEQIYFPNNFSSSFPFSL